MSCAGGVWHKCRCLEVFDSLIKFTKTWERDSGVLHACIKFGNKAVPSVTKIVPCLNRCFKTQQVLAGVCLGMLSPSSALYKMSILARLQSRGLLISC